MIEFRAWPKTPRLFRDITITEKIDGTNACVIIIKAEGDLNFAVENAPSNAEVVVTMGSGAPDFEGSAVYYVAAQSRNRLITPTADNAGFAKWVHQNAAALVDALGPGYHYGEWWGQGIQRGYGLSERRFSLFNVDRYKDIAEQSEGLLRTVPVLYRGPFGINGINYAIDHLSYTGSFAAPGYRNPEGVVVFHSASRQVYKVLLENDDISKTEAAA